MYGSSEERSGRHGGGRHSGWDRDGDYHRGDDYWMDGGGTHYDRGARDYERGSRQPDRKRGAEYFMQEARRRKHEADKITVSCTCSFNACVYSMCATVYSSKCMRMALKFAERAVRNAAYSQVVCVTSD